MDRNFQLISGNNKISEPGAQHLNIMFERDWIKKSMLFLPVIFKALSFIPHSSTDRCFQCTPLIIKIAEVPDGPPR